MGDCRGQFLHDDKDYLQILLGAGWRAAAVGSDGAARWRQWSHERADSERQAYQWDRNDVPVGDECCMFSLDVILELFRKKPVNLLIFGISQILLDSFTWNKLEFQDSISIPNYMCHYGNNCI